MANTITEQQIRDALNNRGVYLGRATEFQQIALAIENVQGQKGVELKKLLDASRKEYAAAVEEKLGECRAVKQYDKDGKGTDWPLEETGEEIYDDKGNKVEKKLGVLYVELTTEKVQLDVVNEVKTLMGSDNLWKGRDIERIKEDGDQNRGLEEYQKIHDEDIKEQIEASEAAVFADKGYNGILEESAVICEMIRGMGNQGDVKKFVKALYKECGTPPKLSKEEAALLGKGNFALPIKSDKTYKMLADFINKRAKSVASTSKECKDASTGMEKAVDDFEKANPYAKSLTPAAKAEIKNALTEIADNAVARDIAKQNIAELGKQEGKEVALGVWSKVAMVSTDAMNKAECDLNKTCVDNEINSSGVNKLVGETKSVVAATRDAATAKYPESLKADGKEEAARAEEASKSAGQAPDRASGPFYKRCCAVVAALFTSLPSEGMTMGYLATFENMKAGRPIYAKTSDGVQQGESFGTGLDGVVAKAETGKAKTVDEITEEERKAEAARNNLAGAEYAPKQTPLQSAQAKYDKLVEEREELCATDSDKFSDKIDELDGKIKAAKQALIEQQVKANIAKTAEENKKKREKDEKEWEDNDKDIGMHSM